MEHVDFAYTTAMDQDDVERRLEEARTGVLALAREGDAYAIPLGHYYDGTGLYLRLGSTDESEKSSFIQSTGTACYVLYGTEETEAPREIDSWSVVVRGTLAELPPERRAEFDTAAINRRFAPIRVFDEPIDEMEIDIYELDVDVVTGRATSP